MKYAARPGDVVALGERPKGVADGLLVRLVDRDDGPSVDAAQYPRRLELLSWGWPASIQHGDTLPRLPIDEYRWYLTEISPRLQGAVATASRVEIGTLWIDVALTEKDVAWVADGANTRLSRPLRPDGEFFRKVDRMFKIMMLCASGRTLLHEVLQRGGAGLTIVLTPVVLSEPTDGAIPGMPRTRQVLRSQRFAAAVEFPQNLTDNDIHVHGEDLTRLLHPAAVALAHEFMHCVEPSYERVPDLPYVDYDPLRQYLRWLDPTTGKYEPVLETTEKTGAMIRGGILWKSQSEYFAITGDTGDPWHSGEAKPWSENLIRVGLGLPARTAYANTQAWLNVGPQFGLPRMPRGFTRSLIQIPNTANVVCGVTGG
jgi:hypothetical protein